MTSDRLLDSLVGVITEQALTADESHARYTMEHPAAFSVMNRLEVTRLDVPQLRAAKLFRRTPDSH